MAKPIVFKEANTSLGRPPGVTKEQCKVLPVWTNGNLCISCWKLTQDERDRVIETGRVYVGVMSGVPSQPPVRIWGIDPFEVPICEACGNRHAPGAVVVKCNSCGVPFNVDGCVYAEDCGLINFTCPTCDELRKDLDDENW